MIIARERTTESLLTGRSTNRKRYYTDSVAEKKVVDVWVDYKDRIQEVSEGILVDVLVPGGYKSSQSVSDYEVDPGSENSSDSEESGYPRSDGSAEECREDVRRALGYK